MDNDNSNQSDNQSKTNSAPSPPSIKPIKKTRSWLKFLRSSIAGTLAGGGCIIVGYPLDTVKVRMQMSDKKKLTLL